MRTGNIAWIGLLGVAVLAAIGLSMIPPSTPNAAAHVASVGIQVEDGDIVYGSPSAPVTVLALVSLTCPHCQRWEGEVMPKVQKDMIDTGKIRLIVRDFPLNQPALAAAAFVRCLPTDARAAAHTALMAKMDSWMSNLPFGMPQAAGIPGQDGTDAMTCSQRAETRQAVTDKAIEANRDYRVQATPSFVVGNSVYTGEISETKLDSLVAAASAAHRF